jgi:hypothetical protein
MAWCLKDNFIFYLSCNKDGHGSKWTIDKEEEDENLVFRRIIFNMSILNIRAGLTTLGSSELSD